MKIYLQVILFFLISFSGSFQFLSDRALDYSTTDSKDSVITVRFTAVGDLMCHSVQYQYAKVGKDSFDFIPVYREVQNFFHESDFLFGNLETVTAGIEKGYSGYPFFNSPDDYVKSLKAVGFDLLATSNNHCLDQGEKGLRRTIDVLNNNDLHYVGTYVSSDDRDSIRLIELNGIKFAILSYTYGTNGLPIPKGKEYLVNLIDTLLIKNDIEKANSLNPDILIVYYHIGEEYKREPSTYQKTIVKKTFDYGADLVLSSHPHVLQPVDYYKTTSNRIDSGFVVYSMGNFISNQQWRYSDAGVIISFNINKVFSSDSVFISDLTFIPTWVFKGRIHDKNEYLILPSAYYKNDSLYTFLSENEREKMKQSYYDSKEILTKYQNNISIHTGE